MVVSPTNSFTTAAGDVINTGFTGNELFQIYSDEGVGMTPFNANGTIANSFATASDGVDWMTLGFSAPGDYAYSLITLQGTALDDFQGESYLGLSVFDFIDAGFIFNPINDPGESIVGSDVQFYANSELEGNDNFVVQGTSDWPFQSNDPAFVNTSAIPEPGTLLLLGAGLLGISAISRKKRKS